MPELVDATIRPHECRRGGQRDLYRCLLSVDPTEGGDAVAELEVVDLIDINRDSRPVAINGQGKASAGEIADVPLVAVVYLKLGTGNALAGRFC